MLFNIKPTTPFLTTHSSSLTDEEIQTIKSWELIIRTYMSGNLIGSCPVKKEHIFRDLDGLGQDKSQKRWILRTSQRDIP